MPCGCFIPRKWRFHKAVWALIILEFPFTVANLALFGIASPNLYRTILWTEGGRMGFNSDPKTVLYAYANYRPVKEPLVWSAFNTQFNLVIGVLCTFFYLVKVTLFLMHVLFPILSLPLHLGLLGLWAASIYIQTAPDTIDPERINKGAPWFITKSCDIVQDGQIKKYCMQAKSAFAVSVVMLIIYALFTILSIISLWPSSTARAAHKEKQLAKRAEKEKFAALVASSPSDNEMTPEEQWQHMWELQQLPRTPGQGGMNPVTPRTRAFRDLGGTGTPGHTMMPMPQQQQQQWYSGQHPQMSVQTQGYGQTNEEQQSPWRTNAEYYGEDRELEKPHMIQQTSNWPPPPPPMPAPEPYRPEADGVGLGVSGNAEKGRGGW